MLIEALTAADIAEVCCIGKSVQAFEVAEGDLFWTVEQLTAWVEAGNDVLLVAKEEDKIVGFALSTLHRPTGKATWENLYVDPSKRNLGIGRALTEEMVTQLQRRGATYVCFFVRAENLTEVAYFERRGFTKGHNFVWFGKHL